MEPEDVSTLNAYIPNWSILDYQTVNKIIGSLRNLNMELYPKWLEWLEQENAKYAKSRKLRENKRDNFEKNIAPRVLKWAKSNLKPGVLIKLEGCRDRGYREVSQFNEKTKDVVCWQLHSSGNMGLERTGVATTNSIFKIKKIFVDWGGGLDGEWQNIQDLI